MLRGVDVGFPQGVLTREQWWTLRARGVAFALLRAGEGTGGGDPTFATNRLRIADAAIPSGPYFVLHPWESPEAQVEAWLRIAGGAGRAGDLPPVLDVELDHTSAVALSPAALRAALVATIRLARQAWGRRPTLYTYPDFWRRHVLFGAEAEELAVLATARLWFAAYAPLPPPAPPPWDRLTFWQSSGGSAYRLPNGAPCDVDFFLGTEGELAALLVDADPVPDALAGAPPAGLVIPGANEGDAGSGEA